MDLAKISQNKSKENTVHQTRSYEIYLTSLVIGRLPMANLMDSVPF
jgi:hypothetical protein